MALDYFEIETRSEPGAERELQEFFVIIRGGGASQEEAWVFFEAKKK